jgi:multidrug efflux pump subunit AcrB
MRGLAERQTASSREGVLSAVIRQAKTRPWLAPVAAGFLAAVLVFVPFSYERTTSYDVTLSLDAAQVDEVQAQRIAAELGKALQSRVVQVRPTGDKLDILASVPAAQAAGVSQLARAFAAELESRHLRAKAAVSPVRSRVQGSVYAMAMSRVIDVNVNTAGRSDAEISAEIKSQLAAAGWDASNVEFRTEGDHHTLQITKDGCGSSAASPGGGECAEINLTLDGKPSLGGGQQ